MFDLMCVLWFLSISIARCVAPYVKTVFRVKFRVCGVGVPVLIGFIDALVGLVVCVSDFCVFYRLLRACELCIVLSAALSILERVADALKGRADYGNAFVSVECVFK